MEPFPVVMSKLKTETIKSKMKYSLNDIPDLLYEGYYWYSDQEKPIIIKDSRIDPEWFKILPFVIEANFYSREKKLSVSVKNIDAEYHVTIFMLDELKEEEYREMLYIGHDIGDLNYIMIETWEKISNPEPSDPLEGMLTYLPSWSAFKGFTNRKNQ